MNQATQHHLDFAPPPTRGLVRSVALALAAHLVLIAILAAGVAWKRETPSVAVEAELWAAVPVEAAPLPSEPPEPLPTTEPEPKPVVPEPPLPAPPPPEPVVAPTPPKTVDIALAKEKERLRKEKKQQEDQAAQKEAQRKAQLEQQRKDKLAQDKERQEKLAKAEHDKAKKAADQAKRDAAAKLAKESAKRTAELRAQQLKRMTELAGGPTSSSGGSGTAAKSAGPSGGYNARVAGRIKPNVTYTDIIVGNPKTEVEVTLSASGDILSRRIVKSSGNASWDTAAVNAIVKTAKLPLDDGKVWSPMIIEMSPQTLLGQ